LYSQSSQPSLSIPKFDEEPDEYVSAVMLLFPYGLYNEPPRPMLSHNMCVQALALPHVSGSSKVRPCNKYPPIVRTPLMSTVCSEVVDLDNTSFPGVPLITLFCNLPENYEDAVVISSEVVDNRWMSHESLIIHPLPGSVVSPKKGSLIQSSTNWWRPADTGLVLKRG
jgi:hypothetical protein